MNRVAALMLVIVVDDKGPDVRENLPQVRGRDPVSRRPLSR